MNANAEVTVPVDGVRTVQVVQNFSRAEESGEDHTEGTDGGGCADSGCSAHSGTDGSGGGCGSQGGQGGGAEAQGGSDGTHGHVEIYDRLPPIHLFLVLENSGNGLDTYRFDVTIQNHTGVALDGFLHALKRNDEGWAFFKGAEENGVLDPTLKGQPFKKKIEWTGGPLLDGAGLTFSFMVGFKDLPAGYIAPEGTCAHPTDGGTGYTIMLQSFPLVKPVPEPGTLVLLGSGLFGLAASGRRRGH